MSDKIEHMLHIDIHILAVGRTFVPCTCSLMALAPTSPLYFSGRASELVIGRS